MRPRAISPLVCAVAVLGAAIGHAADRPISGDQLKIKTDGEHSQIVFTSRDPGFLFPAATDDPSTNGAVVEIFPATVTGLSLTMPPGVGKPGWAVKTTGGAFYKFNNASAPAGISVVKTAVIKQGKQLKLLARQSPAAPHALQAVAVRITTGTTRNCALFDGASVKRNELGYFLAKKAPAPAIADCSDASLGMPTCDMGPAPTCGGYCGGDAVCTAAGSTCKCVSPSAPCGDTYPTCNGVCPVGEECVAGTDWQYGCGCIAVGASPCGGETAPMCSGGSCVIDQQCESIGGFCRCFPDGICNCPSGYSCEIHPPAFSCVPG